MKEKEILIKGALLHDIGKVCYRAMNKRINHSKLGGDFLEQYLKSNEETERLLNCVRYHHKDYLQKAKLDKNDLAYIVMKQIILLQAWIDEKMKEKKRVLIRN